MVLIPQLSKLISHTHMYRYINTYIHTYSYVHASRRSRGTVCISESAIWNISLNQQPSKPYLHPAEVASAEPSTEYREPITARKKEKYRQSVENCRKRKKADGGGRFPLINTPLRISPPLAKAARSLPRSLPFVDHCAMPKEEQSIRAVSRYVP